MMKMKVPELVHKVLARMSFATMAIHGAAEPVILACVHG